MFINVLIIFDMIFKLFLILVIVVVLSLLNSALGQVVINIFLNVWFYLNYLWMFSTCCSKDIDCFPYGCCSIENLCPEDSIQGQNGTRDGIRRQNGIRGQNGTRDGIRGQCVSRVLSVMCFISGWLRQFYQIKSTKNWIKIL